MMRRQLRIPTLTIICLFFITVNQAQPGKRMPKWIPESGFWVVESNLKSPERSIIYFYTNERALVYKELIEGTKLNLRKKRVLMHLKKVLNKTIKDWEAQHIAKENQKLLSTALKLN